MELKTNDIRIILQNDLGQSTVNRYAVSQFCQSARLPRATFYRSYKDINQIFAEYVSYNFREILNSPKYKTDLKRFELLIDHIYESRLIYQNIYTLAPDRLFLNTIFCNNLLPLLRRKFERTHAISETGIRMIAESMTHYLIGWINSGFEQEKEVILNHMGSRLRVAESIKELL